MEDSSITEIRHLGQYVLAIGRAISTAGNGNDIEQPIYDAQNEFFDQFGLQGSFLVLGFAEQLRDALMVTFRNS